MLPITAIIITKNEENNIARVLESLSFLPEVIVMDAFSTDTTAEICRSYSNVKFFQSEWVGYSANKNLAIEKSSNDWIFWIDADEEVDEKLQNEISSLFTSSHAADLAGYFVPRLTYFLDQPIHFSGWYPGYVMRLFHRKRAQLNNHILHEGVEVTSGHSTSMLKNHLHHYSYPTIHSYFKKMNDYGDYGALELTRKGKKFSTLNLVFNPIVTFIKFYILKQGFRDGRAGLIISIGSAFSNFIKYANLFAKK